MYGYETDKTLFLGKLLTKYSISGDTMTVTVINENEGDISDIKVNVFCYGENDELLDVKTSGRIMIVADSSREVEIENIPDASVRFEVILSGSDTSTYAIDFAF